MLSEDSSVHRWKPAIRITILLLICSVVSLVRIFSVIRYESIIHEFDPWFNFRATKYLVNTDFKEFWNFFDSESWYPLGRNVGATVYPGLMVILYLFSPPVASSTSSFTNWPSPSISGIFVCFWPPCLPLSLLLLPTCSPPKSPKNMVLVCWQLSSLVFLPVTCLDQWLGPTITKEYQYSLWFSLSTFS